MFTIEKFNFLAGNDHLTVEFLIFYTKLIKIRGASRVRPTRKRDVMEPFWQ